MLRWRGARGGGGGRGGQRRFTHLPGVARVAGLAGIVHLTLLLLATRTPVASDQDSNLTPRPGTGPTGASQNRLVRGAREKFAAAAMLLRHWDAAFQRLSCTAR